MAALRSPSLELIAPSPFPLVREGDCLATLITESLGPTGVQPGDIFVVAQKIVSKAEGRYFEMASVHPGEEASRLALITGKDPRLVELVLRESERVLRAVPGVLITRHKRGWIMANAGIDASNVDRPGHVLLLPIDPDASAAALRRQLWARLGSDVGVVICDSWGRPWRLGTVGAAIGASGVGMLMSLRGTRDLEGRPLEVTEVASGDEIAAAASLLMGQAAEGRPVVVIRGLNVPDRGQNASNLIRPLENDLFSS